MEDTYLITNTKINKIRKNKPSLCLVVCVSTSSSMTLLGLVKATTNISDYNIQRDKEKS